MLEQHVNLTDGKFTISMSDLIKMMSVVLAIGMSYAMASSRISLIENSIRDGQVATVELRQRVAALEQYKNAHELDSQQRIHMTDLRLQSIEERIFGASRSRTTSAPVAPTPP